MHHKIDDDGGASFYLAFSCALHGGLLLAAAGSVPPLDETPLDFDRTVELVSFLPAGTANAEPEEDEVRAVTAAESSPDGLERVDSRCDQTPGGSMGKPDAAHTHLHFGVQGPADNPDPHFARSTSSRGEWEYFSVSWARPLDGWWGGELEAPVVFFGRDDSLGNDVRSARGNTWGDDLGAAFGSPGVGTGRRVLCDHCGGVGLGVGRWESGDSGGGTTGTESAAARLR
jgi:hypothetical protein